jgi:hypothetical protein
MSRGTYPVWNVELYSTIKTFTFTSSIATLFTGRARPFQVSMKDAHGGGMPWRHVMPHMLAACLSVIAIAVGALHLVNPVWYRLPPASIGICLFWSAVVLILVVGAIMRFRRGTRRGRYRFPIRVGLIWRRDSEETWHPGTSIDLSATGVHFAHGDAKLVPGDAIELIILPGSPEVTAPGRNAGGEHGCPDHAVRVMGTIAGNHPIPAAEQHVGLRIESFDTEEDANRYAFLLHSQEAQELDGRL